MHFVRSTDVKEKAVGGDLALYIEAHRSIHVLNPTARFIWESLKEPLTFEELLFVMREGFEADEDELRRDLRQMIDECLALGIVIIHGDGPALS
jgi:hypothetical protein